MLFLYTFTQYLSILKNRIMRIKYLKNSVASLSILSGLFCLTGCQDDGVLKGEVGIEEYVPQGTNDVAGSVLIHIIEEGDVERFAHGGHRDGAERVR